MCKFSKKFGGEARNPKPQIAQRVDAIFSDLVYLLTKVGGSSHFFWGGFKPFGWLGHPWWNRKLHCYGFLSQQHWMIPVSAGIEYDSWMEAETLFGENNLPQCIRQLDPKQWISFYRYQEVYPGCEMDPLNSGIGPSRHAIGPSGMIWANQVWNGSITDWWSPRLVMGPSGL